MTFSELFQERLEECRSTYKLNLGYSSLTELPDNFVDMVKRFNPYILELDLTSNKLETLPHDLHKLEYLRVLRVKYNNLMDIPPVVFELAQCMTLDLAGNKLCTLPDEVARLTQLRDLDLSGNAITQVSEHLDELQHLQVLHLENNQLDALPDCIGRCPSLIKFNASTNLLRTLPPSMGQLRKIQRLDFANNMIQQVPPCMGHLRALKEFSLRYNNLDADFQAATDEGLSKFLAFLKNKEEEEEVAERERMRPIGTQVGAHMEYRCKAPVAQMLKTAEGDVEVNNRPWSRHGHTLCKHGDRFYLFGGNVVRTGKKTHDLYWISLDQMIWHYQECGGDAKPVPRDGHCAIIDPDTDRMIVYGGRSQEKRRLNDVWVLDLKTFKWYKQNCEGATPASRDHASAIYMPVQNCMVVFGGHTTGKRLNDLAVLDLTSFTWGTWSSNTDAPPPRESAALCVGHGNLLFLHGGTSNFGMDDLWVYDQKASGWTALVCDGRRPPIRRNHQLFVHNSELYLFGGFDELGAPSTSMYKLAVDYGTNFKTATLTWEEMDSERHFNRNRSAIFAESAALVDGRTVTKGHLYCFQLGSKTMGHPNDEDAEHGTVYYDVFAVCDVTALSVKEVDRSQLKPKNGKRVRVEHTTNQIAKTPKTFVTTSAHEQQVEQYLKDFQASFTELYRHRRPLYLLPKNECGVPKFVCTTIRPTKLPYPELYELQGAVSFVASAIQFEPLENELHPPEFLLSPMSTLSFQAGDSFDMATLLVSILIGCGFDAYVVFGYAPKDIVKNDQTKSTCPLIEAEEAAAQAADKAAAADGTKRERKEAKYTIRPELEFKSKFLLGLEASAAEEAKAAEEAAAAEAKKQALEERRAFLAASDRVTTYEHRLVHAWVLVKAAQRQVTSDVFIECASGRTYEPAHSPYFGIEAAWNDKNFWICVGMPEPHSDSRLHPAKAHFDWGDAEMWEPILPPPPPPPPATHEPAAAHATSTANAGEGAGDGDGAGSETGGSAREGASQAGSRAMSRLASRADLARSTHGSSKNLAGLMSRDDDDDEASAASERPLIEMPTSWVPKLEIPRDIVDMRVPKGSKHTRYQFSQHELYALFGESSRFDGMVEKLQMYADEEHQIPQEERQYFLRRKDKLRQKRMYHTPDGKDLSRIVEYFDPGAAFGISKLVQIFQRHPDTGVVMLTQRTGEYFSTARLEGLTYKDEVVGKKMIERYEGREDCLVYRSVTYGPHAPDDPTDKPLPIRKMTEKFSRNQAIPVVNDIAKRTFYFEQDTIRVDYHIAPDRITASYRIYTKDGHSHIVEMDPLRDKPDEIAQLEQFQALLLAEKECIMSVRQSEWEAKEFAKVRKQLQESIQLITPYYDSARVNADESDDDEEDVEEQVFDYLSPFLPKLSGTRGLSRQEALRVREDCLRALKERLIERANIIQSRRDEEAAALAKRQANFQRDRDQLNKEAEREYEIACEKSMFKIQILEKRLKRHEEQALRKYYELDTKLRKDVRLAVLLEYTGGSG